MSLLIAKQVGQFLSSFLDSLAPKLLELAGGTPSSWPAAPTARGNAPAVQRTASRGRCSVIYWRRTGARDCVANGRGQPAGEASTSGLTPRAARRWTKPMPLLQRDTRR